MKVPFIIALALLASGCSGMAPRGPQEVAETCPPGSRAVAEANATQSTYGAAQGTRVACVRPDGSFVASREAVAADRRGFQARREEASNFERKSTSYQVREGYRGKEVSAGYAYQNPYLGLQVRLGTGGSGSYSYRRGYQNHKGMCHVTHDNGLSGWYMKSSVSDSIRKHAHVRCY